MDIFRIKKETFFIWEICHIWVNDSNNRFILLCKRFSNILKIDKSVKPQFSVAKNYLYKEKKNYRNLICQKAKFIPYLEKIFFLGTKPHHNNTFFSQIWIESIITYWYTLLIFKDITNVYRIDIGVFWFKYLLFIETSWGSIQIFNWIDSIFNRFCGIEPNWIDSIHKVEEV